MKTIEKYIHRRLLRAIIWYLKKYWPLSVQYDKSTEIYKFEWTKIFNDFIK